MINKLKTKEIKLSYAFIGVDIAFALLIMSTTFLILFSIQTEINKQVKNQDLLKFDEANQELLHNFMHNNTQAFSITTLHHKTYHLQQIQGKNDALLLYILKSQ